MLSMFGLSGNHPDFLDKLAWDMRPLADFDCFGREVCSKIYLRSIFGRDVPLPLVLMETEHCDEEEKMKLVPRDLPSWFPVYVRAIAQVLTGQNFRIIFELDAKHSIAELFEIDTNADGLMALLNDGIISKLVPVRDQFGRMRKTFGCEFTKISTHDKESCHARIKLGMV